MIKLAISKIKDTEVFLDKNIIDEYKKLDEKLDGVLEKISKKQKK